MSHSSEPRPYPLEELLAHSGWLRGLAASLVADPGRAEDLVQETWLAALRHPPRAGSTPRPWLARVFRNLARNAQRNAVTRARHELGAAGEPRAAAPDAIAAEVETQRLLAECVGRLDDPGRTIVVLRYFRGLDSAAIARELGLPPGTVRWRLKQALEQLRADLDRRCEGGRAAWSLVLGSIAERTRSAPPAPPLLPISTPVLSALGALVLAGAGALAWSWVAGTELQTSPQRGNVAEAGSAEHRADLMDRSPADFAAPPSQRTQAPLPAAAQPDSAPPTEALLAGVFLIDGQPPTWPIEATLEPWPPRTPGDVADNAPGRMRLHLRPSEGGHFRVGPLPMTWNGRLTVEGFAFENGRDSQLVAGPEPQLVVRLRSSPDITGRVVAPATRRAVPEAPFVSWLVHREHGLIVHEETSPAVCDELGRFRIPLLGGGAVQGALHFEVPGLGRRLLVLEPLEKGESLALGDIELEPTQSLRFRLLDASGAPLEGGGATRNEPGGLASVAPTDADGFGELELPLDGAAVRFAAPKHEEVRATVRPGEPCEIRLEPVSALEFELLAPRELLSRATVLVTSAEELFTPTPEGEHELVFVRGTPCTSKTFLPALDGRPATIELRYRIAEGRLLLSHLRPGLPFQLEVLDPSGRTLAVRSLSVAAREWQQLELALD